MNFVYSVSGECAYRLGHGDAVMCSREYMFSVIVSFIVGLREFWLQYDSPENVTVHVSSFSGNIFFTFLENESVKFLMCAYL